MPCYDERSSSEYVRNNEVPPLKRELDRVEAMLCGLIKAMYKENPFLPVLTHYDDQEAGITQTELLHWWISHQRKDRNSAQEKK
jgi:hypothetical protein